MASREASTNSDAVTFEGMSLTEINQWVTYHRQALTYYEYLQTRAVESLQQPGGTTQVNQIEQGRAQPSSAQSSSLFPAATTYFENLSARDFQSGQNAQSQHSQQSAGPPNGYVSAAGNESPYGQPPVVASQNNDKPVGVANSYKHFSPTNGQKRSFVSWKAENYDPLWAQKEGIDMSRVEFTTKIKFEVLFAQGAFQIGDCLVTNAFYHSDHDGTEETQVQFEFYKMNKNLRKIPSFKVKVHGLPTYDDKVDGCIGTNRIITYLKEKGFHGDHLTTNRLSKRLYCFRGDQFCGSYYDFKQAYHLWVERNNPGVNTLGAQRRVRRSRGPRNVSEVQDEDDEE